MVYIKKTPKIRCHNIKKVEQAIDVPVVLHGGSGIPNDQIREANSSGIGKINVNTENIVAYTNAVRNYLQANPKPTDPRAYQGAARKSYERSCKK
ncbi:class II fructose-bisphosphate aldolase [Alkalihalobacillus sp. MEB130]|uniref:class II fructose-bisphosphate aldolase n=1 Tax=Alkalihalobacillus sp. MEB130 TaxID=2976704 RepID=UPI0028E01CCA|nr:class II fructose-bisphosphate aldolase [Alkalihalobacillus sp. MEB130]MDT8861802.1 class II fructose-bisphosphate aldolase [Alkalihalobacillus sp. MEB130]